MTPEKKQILKLKEQLTERNIQMIDLLKSQTKKDKYFNILFGSTLFIGFSFMILWVFS